MKISNETKAIIGYEFDRAVRKHGPTFSSIDEGLKAMMRELYEAFEAQRKNDIYGRHGVRREIAHTIVVGLKILEGLELKSKAQQPCSSLR